MIVLDASALADWLLRSPVRGAAVVEAIAEAGEAHSLDFSTVEVLSVIRRKRRGDELTGRRARAAIDDLLAAPIVRHPATPLAGRVWELRATHTPYDAAYIALAEALDAPLVTTDGRLARSHGHRATMRLAG